MKGQVSFGSRFSPQAAGFEAGPTSEDSGAQPGVAGRKQGQRAGAGEGEEQAPVIQTPQKPVCDHLKL